MANLLSLTLSFVEKKKGREMPMRESEEKDHDHRVWCRRETEKRNLYSLCIPFFIARRKIETVEK